MDKKEPKFKETLPDGTKILHVKWDEQYEEFIYTVIDKQCVDGSWTVKQLFEGLIK